MTPHVIFNHTGKPLRVFTDVSGVITRASDFDLRLKAEPVFPKCEVPMEKPWHNRGPRVQRESSKTCRRASRDAEKIDKHALRPLRILIGQNPNRAIFRQCFQDSARRLIFVDGLIAAQTSKFRNERVHARIVDGPYEKMQRVSEKRLREGSQFPGAHVPGEEKHSLALRLRRREILESVEQHNSLDIVFGVSGELGEFRSHPSQLPHHAANRRALLLFVPFGKRQLQIFRCGGAQTRTHPEQKSGDASARKSRDWARQGADRFKQQPGCRKFQAFSHTGIIAGAGLQ